MRCDICDVYLPNETTADQHRNGIKHKKRLAAQQASDDLLQRSVFVYGFPVASLTEMDFRDYFTRKCGPVSAVRFDADCGYAIVEFASALAASNAIETKKHKIGNFNVVAKQRQQNSNRPQISKEVVSPERADLRVPVKNGECTSSFHERACAVNAVAELALVSAQPSTPLNGCAQGAHSMSSRDVASVSSRVKLGKRKRSPEPEAFREKASKLPKISMKSKKKRATFKRDLLRQCSTASCSDILADSKLEILQKVQSGWVSQAKTVSQNELQFLRANAAFSDVPQREDLRQRYENALRLVFGDNLVLAIFGSSQTGLGFRGCDVDLKLIYDAKSSAYALGLTLTEYKVALYPELPRSKVYLLNTPIRDLVKDADSRISVDEWTSLAPAEKIRLLCKILKYLGSPGQRKRSGIQPRQFLIVRGYCPVLKFRSYDGYHCEVSVSDLPGLRNSQLLSMLSSSFQFGSILFGLHYWTTMNRLCNTNAADKSKVTSYALNLLFLTFLQTSGILPPIEDMQQPSTDAAGSSVSVDEMVLEGWRCSFWNRLPLALRSKLDSLDDKIVLSNFFRFCSQLKFESTVLCPKKGSVVDIAEFKNVNEMLSNDRMKLFKFRAINIQDPFVLRRNVTANVSKRAVLQLTELANYSGDILQSKGLFECVRLIREENAFTALTKKLRISSPSKDGDRLNQTFCLTLTGDANSLPAALEKCLREVLQFQCETARTGVLGNRSEVVVWSGSVKVTYRTWVGRRILTRELKRTNPSLSNFDLEVCVTQSILKQDAGCKLNTPLTFDVSLKSADGDGQFELVFQNVSAVPEFKTLLSSLQKLLPRLLRNRSFIASLCFVSTTYTYAKVTVVLQILSAERSSAAATDDGITCLSVLVGKRRLNLKVVNVKLPDDVREGSGSGGDENPASEHGREDTGSVSSDGGEIEHENVVAENSAASGSYDGLDDALYVCMYCGKEFQTADNVRKHELSCLEEIEEDSDDLVSGGANAPIMVSAKPSAMEVAYYRQIVKTERPLRQQGLVCRFCCALFETTEQLTVHEDAHGAAKAFHCTHCDESFMHASDLEVHQKVHIENPFVCNLCGLYYSSLLKLQRHEASHLGVKPFACQFCDKSFNTNSQLRLHENSHTGQKPYKCAVCNKTFSRTGNYNLHMRLHASGKRFFCSHCGKWYRTEHEMRAHERCCLQVQRGEMVDPEKPLRYLCSFCSKSFHRKRDKVVHERSHTGERPYSCGYCGRRFTQSQTLTSHIRIHTNERPYACGFCSKEFRDASSLRKHEFTRHYAVNTQEGGVVGAFDLNDFDPALNCEAMLTIGPGRDASSASVSGDVLVENVEFYADSKCGILFEDVDDT